MNNIEIEQQKYIDNLIFRFAQKIYSMLTVFYGMFIKKKENY